MTEGAGGAGGEGGGTGGEGRAGGEGETPGAGLEEGIAGEIGGATGEGCAWPKTLEPVSALLGKHVQLLAGKVKGKGELPDPFLVNQLSS